MTPLARTCPPNPLPAGFALHPAVGLPHTPCTQKQKRLWFMLLIMPPPRREGGIIKWAAVSVCPSVRPSVSLSRAAT